jgi:hypothetical protein
MRQPSKLLQAVYAETPLPPPEPWYNPRRLSYLLHTWGDLQALAETPGSAHGLTHSKPTQNVPRVGKFPKGMHSDRYRWAVVKADIERAVAQLSGLAAETVTTLMGGDALDALCPRYKWEAINDAFSNALTHMAEFLEGPAVRDTEIDGDAPQPGAMPTCRHCGAELGWERRSDAQYCSSRCNLRAWRAQRAGSSGVTRNP